MIKVFLGTKGWGWNLYGIGDSKANRPWFLGFAITERSRVKRWQDE